ncbi:MAG: hypothetical protein HXO13_06145 [Prevotella salivae]|nr:hypothetical protein [Segatella salivae]
MVDCVEKVQHLQRCTTQTIRYPRVVCAIAWQPWAIKGTTLTALTSMCLFIIRGMIHWDIIDNVL